MKCTQHEHYKQITILAPSKASNYTVSITERINVALKWSIEIMKFVFDCFLAL